MHKIHVLQLSRKIKRYTKCSPLIRTFPHSVPLPIRVRELLSSGFDILLLQFLLFLPEDVSRCSRKWGCRLRIRGGRVHGHINIHGE